MVGSSYFYKFRQTSPKPPGAWVLCGPFESYEAAKADRQNSKQWDCELTSVFSASSKADAEAMPPV